MLHMDDLTHLSQMNMPTIFTSTSLIPILVVLAGIFHVFPFFYRTFYKQAVKILIRHRIMHYAVSDLGLHCLPIYVYKNFFLWLLPILMVLCFYVWEHPRLNLQWFWFKTSQKMGPRLKVSSDRLVEPGIERGTLRFKASDLSATARRHG